MLSMLEKKIRLRARQLYEEGGRVEGRALEDWIRAEAEILKSSILAPLWNARRKLLGDDMSCPEFQAQQA
jgi:hypothetical protein